MNKEYKNFVLTTLLWMILTPFILLSIGLYIGEKVIGKEIIKYGESQVINYWISVKKNYANEVDKKKLSKIVILSGSNSLFGVNTKHMEQVLKKPVLNYGLHGGLLNYIFFDVKRILNKGDIVILPLEYAYYCVPYSTENLSSTIIEYIIGYDYDYYKQLSTTDKIKVINYLFKLKTLTSIGKEPDFPKNLNSNGDITNIGNEKQPYISQHPNGPVLESEVSLNIREKMPLYLFLKWCKGHGIMVYATYPNIQHKNKTTQKEEEFFAQIKSFYGLSNIEFVGDTEKSFYDNKYIYNTEYHLNSLGQEKRTKDLINLFKNKLVN